MFAEHAAAILDLIRGDVDLTVFDGAPPDSSVPPYVVVWLSLDTEESDRACGVSDIARWRVTTHSLGGSGEAARLVAGRVRATLVDITPVIAGRICWPIRHDFSLPPTPDQSTGHLWVDQTSTWTFRSEPAA